MRIYSFTVNYQRLAPELDVPFAIVLVEFPDYPGVRVVGRFRGCPPEDIAIDDERRDGLRARARRLRHPELRGRRRRPLMGTDRFEQRGRDIGRAGSRPSAARWTGPGCSSRSTPCSPPSTTPVCTCDDIDGLAMFPGGGKSPICPGTPTETSTRSRTPSASTTTWRQGQVEGMSLPFSAPAHGGGHRPGAPCGDLAHGQGGQRGPPVPAGGPPTVRSKPVAEGSMAWWLPFGALVARSASVAPFATRYMHEYGVTTGAARLDPGHPARPRGAQPAAPSTGTPLSVEEYLAARMISSPICLYDCDVPADGARPPSSSPPSTTVPDLRAPVRIEAMAGVIDRRPSWEQWEDMGRVGYATAAAMWNRTDLTARRRPRRPARTTDSP